MTDAGREHPDRPLRRAVIAGASGFIGRRLRTDLVADGVSVRPSGDAARTRRGATRTRSPGSSTAPTCS